MSKRSNPTNKAAGRPGLFTAAMAAHFHTATVSLNTFQLFCFSNWLQMKLMYIPESRGAMTRRWIKISNFSFYCWRRTLTIERCYGLGTQVSWILHNVRPSMCVPKQKTQKQNKLPVTQMGKSHIYCRLLKSIADGDASHSDLINLQDHLIPLQTSSRSRFPVSSTTVNLPALHCIPSSSSPFCCSSLAGLTDTVNQIWCLCKN